MSKVLEVGGVSVPGVLMGNSSSCEHPTTPPTPLLGCPVEEYSCYHDGLCVQVRPHKRLPVSPCLTTQLHSTSSSPLHLSLILKSITFLTYRRTSPILQTLLSYLHPFHILLYTSHLHILQNERFRLLQVQVQEFLHLQLSTLGLGKQHPLCCLRGE